MRNIIRRRDRLLSKSILDVHVEVFNDNGKQNAYLYCNGEAVQVLPFDSVEDLKTLVNDYVSNMIMTNFIALTPKEKITRTKRVPRLRRVLQSV